MNLYQNLYDLINTYIYNNTIIEGSWEELTTILLSTIGCIFLIALPFLLVWKIIKVVL